MKEDTFVKEALIAAEEVLGHPLFIRRGASLLYQVTVNNKLRVTVDPRSPTRGQSAFQTNLCVFERIDSEIEIPRVVMEFKTRLTTHDVLTYSSKARKHKQIYPCLRYGIVIANEETVPSRFFTRNEALDFCIAAASYRNAKSVREVLGSILSEEVSASRRLEGIAFEKTRARVFRNEIKLEGSP